MADIISAVELNKLYRLYLSAFIHTLREIEWQNTQPLTLLQTAAFAIGAQHAVVDEPKVSDYESFTRTLAQLTKGCSNE